MRLLPVSFVALAVGSVACLDATQIEMTLRTDVPFAPGRTVAIAVSKTTAGDASEPATTAEDGWTTDGKIGTLVLLPSDQRDEPVSVRTVMGIGRDPSTCTTADPVGCIFARRRLSFVPHESLALPITLYAACAGVPCDENSTCTALGTCVSAALDPQACADGKTCEPGAGSPPNASSSGSPPDASSSSGSVPGDAATSSSSSGSASSSSGASNVCDAADVTIERDGFFSLGTDITADVTNTTTLRITIDTPGEHATFAKDIGTPSSVCPLHFVLQVDELGIDTLGDTVSILRVTRSGQPELRLEVTRLATGHSLRLAGSARSYVWPLAATGVVELVIPLEGGSERPRLVVDGNDTVFDDLPAVGSDVVSLNVEFGLSGANSHIAYQRVRHFFAP